MIIKSARAAWVTRIKKASIETDMGARIMLSLIPEVMDPMQKANIITNPRMWSTDVKAYRAATKGAKALVINGAKACVGELRHYIAMAVDYNDREEIKRRKNIIDAGKSAIADEKYVAALIYSRDAFEDVEAWDRSFGGPAWATIANTLLEINKVANRAEEERKANNWEAELDAMKEAVVLMNVFDGLAHNTGTVMPKLLAEEMGKASTDESDYNYNKEFIEYKNKVLRLMDAKELRDPIAVYKEIEPIIDSSQYKYLFKDFIHKLRQHPGYRNTQNVSQNLEKIRMKKILKKSVDELLEHMKKLTATTSSIRTRGYSSFNDAFAANKTNIQRFESQLLWLKSLMSSVLLKLAEGNFPENPILKKILFETRNVYDRFDLIYDTWDNAVSNFPLSKPELLKTLTANDIESKIKEFYNAANNLCRQFYEEVEKMYAE